MRPDRRRGSGLFGGMVSVVLALSLATGTAASQNQRKSYPEEGKVVGTGTSQSIRYTYRAETDTRIYELECDKVPRPGLSSYTPRECGGAKRIQIGDVIHLRKDKAWAYIPVTETNGHAGEQRLRVLSEELKPGAKPADKTSATQPEKTDAKPEHEKRMRSARQGNICDV